MHETDGCEVLTCWISRFSIVTHCSCSLKMIGEKCPNLRILNAADNPFCDKLEQTAIFTHAIKLQVINLSITSDYPLPSMCAKIQRTIVFWSSPLRAHWSTRSTHWTERIEYLWSTTASNQYRGKCLAQSVGCAVLPPRPLHSPKNCTHDWVSAARALDSRRPSHASKTHHGEARTALRQSRCWWSAVVCCHQSGHEWGRWVLRAINTHGTVVKQLSRLQNRIGVTLGS